MSYTCVHQSSPAEPKNGKSHTHKLPINSLFSVTTCVSWHQKGKPFWILLKQEMMGWQWHQLDYIQIIWTSLQTDNHTSTSSLKLFTGWMFFLMPNQQCQSIEGRQQYVTARHFTLLHSHVLGIMSTWWLSILIMSFVASTQLVDIEPG